MVKHYLNIVFFNIKVLSKEKVSEAIRIIYINYPKLNHRADRKLIIGYLKDF